MADTRRSPPADSGGHAAIRGAVAGLLLQALPEGGHVGVALSGGRDSVALLDAALAVAEDVRCSVSAFHIGHGLSPNADIWSRFCGELCATRGVPFASRNVHVVRAARISVEAAARAARYDALAALAHEHGAAAVLLGHHADDQAETMLLQLLRGAGPRGLAAMPRSRVECDIRWLRPFLALPRAAIDRYATQRALHYIEDESNADPRYRRNALRTTVVPALRALAPGYPGVLGRAAEHQAEAAALLDELAELDARVAYDGASLDCAVLRALDPPRARNLLRWFLRRRGLRAPSATRLADMLRQLVTAGRDARTDIAHAGAKIGVHRGRVMIHRPAPAYFALEWSGASSVVLPHGTLLFNATRGTGIAAHHLRAARVTLRAGTSGERLGVAGCASRRAVADLLREAGVPHWDRIGVPRVYCGDALAAVARAGVDATFAARRDEPAFALDWRPG
jgi:tRNA(Ile)-lysidine synthase